jgi:hypothetical protein
VSATEEYTREDFTAVTLQPLIASLTGSPPGAGVHGMCGHTAAKAALGRLTR